MTKPIKTASLYDLFLWMIRRRKRFRITGNSMKPALLDGEVVLVDQRAFREQAPIPGDVVIAKHPYQCDLWLIKRIIRSQEDGRCYLAGDNPDESTDSRAFGLISPDQILGRVERRCGKIRYHFHPKFSD